MFPLDTQSCNLAKPYAGPTRHSCLSDRDRTPGPMLHIVRALVAEIPKLGLYLQAQYLASTLAVAFRRMVSSGLPIRHQDWTAADGVGPGIAAADRR